MDPKTIIHGLDGKFQKRYKVLNEVQIRLHQEEDIAYVSCRLSLPRAKAITLLWEYKWNIRDLEGDLLSGDQKNDNVSKITIPEVQLLQPKNIDEMLFCAICLDSFPPDFIHALDCGHPFCLTCGKGYISSAISEGHRCLQLKCPAAQSCNVSVGKDTIDMFASDEEKKRYSYFSIKCYVESKKTIKWCPSPAGCDYAVELFDEISSSFSSSSSTQFVATQFDVTCLCSYKFCWNCTKEGHSPIDCDTMARQKLAESTSMQWIFGNTKPCPKCKRPIQKTQGCRLMKCASPCNFQFCWVCLCPLGEPHSASCNGQSLIEFLHSLLFVLFLSSLPLLLLWWWSGLYTK